MANWFGKGKKGLLFGIWNSHTSVGNILGGILAGIIPTTQLLILEAIKCSLIWPRFTKNILGGRKLVTSHWLFIIKYYVKLQHELYFHEIFNNKKISMKFHEIFLNYYQFLQVFSLKMIGLIPSLYPEVSLRSEGSSFGSF